MTVAAVGGERRFCPSCKRLRSRADFHQRHAVCRDCHRARQRERRAADPGREAQLACARRARGRLRREVAEIALWNVIDGQRRVLAEHLSGQITDDELEELQLDLLGLLHEGAAIAEDRFGLEPGSALNIIAAARRRQPPLG